MPRRARAVEGLSPCQPIAWQHLAYMQQARACLDTGGTAQAAHPPRKPTDWPGLASASDGLEDTWHMPLALAGHHMAGRWLFGPGGAQPCLDGWHCGARLSPGES
ncbi:protein SMG9 [Platysternon megacephalum]|uniref:Protein SMG9 n=1 Tax=Platysternon megacephalum TaxID=55544 RepID=A0A4D9DMT7_9SAUR|nr:protein SMG9 [Platysternon megacephalum]